ncbi:unnamed protein product, partial [Brassica oleracea var. botrytis]
MIPLQAPTPISLPLILHTSQRITQRRTEPVQFMCSNREAFEEITPQTYVFELLSLLLGDDYTGKRQGGLSTTLTSWSWCGMTQPMGRTRLR